jgi:hypothetical protein
LGFRIGLINQSDFPFQIQAGTSVGAGLWPACAIKPCRPAILPDMEMKIDIF